MPYLTEGPKTAPENSWAQKHQGKLGLLSLTIPSLLRCSNSWLHVLISPLSKWLSILAKEVSSVSYSSNNVQKGRVSTACLIYLVTDNNVDTSRALSVNLVNLVERNIKHRGKFSSNFWGNHFFQVDCMINAGCPIAILASTACSLWLPLQHSAIRLLLADIDG